MYADSSTISSLLHCKCNGHQPSPAAAAAAAAACGDRVPFSAAGASDSAIEAAIHCTVPAFPSRMSEPATDFIAAALHKQPDKRPSVLQMLHHPWIRSFQVHALLLLLLLLLVLTGACCHMPGDLVPACCWS
jgi:serine/threonine protein kinase